MSTKKHIVIYSHGFDVCKDDNGFLSDIAEHLPEVESILFDYYDLNEANNELLICPTSHQVEKNVITLTKTGNTKHLEENLGSVNWNMSDEDIELLRIDYPIQFDKSNTVPLN